MADVTLGQALAAMVVRARSGALPSEVLDGVGNRVLDVVGNCVAAVDLPTSRGVRAHAAGLGGAAQARAIGLREPVPAPLAALVNGTLAHSLDYDDTHLPSILHPSASVVPAALAAAELAGAGSRDLLRAIVGGLEVTVRVGMAGYDEASRDSTYFDRGQHATSICGALGSAAAAMALLGGDEDDVVSAMAVAASMSSGIIESNRNGGTVKRIHCGWAAHAGVTAAMLVRRGLTGPATFLEGRFGLFEAFLGGRYDATAVSAGLGDEWRMAHVHYKPYPANHFTHAGIDAALSLREAGVRLDRLRSVRLGVAGPPKRTIGEPLEAKQAPRTGYEAQFSGPYTVVAALLGGSGLGVGLDDFTDELAQHPERRRHMAKVTVVEDARCNEIFPHELPAVLEVVTDDGARLERRVDANRGGHRRPLSTAELEVKFTDNAVRSMAPAEADRVRAAVARLPVGGSLGDVLEPLRAVGSPTTGATTPAPTDSRR